MHKQWKIKVIPFPSSALLRRVIPGEKRKGGAQRRCRPGPGKRLRMQVAGGMAGKLRIELHLSNKLNRREDRWEVRTPSRGKDEK